MDRWAIAILPLVGVVLGAALQFWLSRAAAREKRGADLRSQAYADYLRAVAAAGHLRSDEDLRDAHRDAADAKARIAVYGEKPLSSRRLRGLRRLAQCSPTLVPDVHSLLWSPGCDRKGMPYASVNLSSYCSALTEKPVNLTLRYAPLDGQFAP